MDEQSRIVTLAANGRLLDENGQPVTPPEGWAFLPAGDAGVTRKVSSAGVFWRVQVKMGRRIISKGLWAPKNTIELAVLQMQSTRQTELYQKKVEAAKRRREKIQTEYVDDFCHQVECFLNFHPIYKDMGAKMAKLVSLHATPVGSGTVARTATISIGSEPRGQLSPGCAIKLRLTTRCRLPGSKGSAAVSAECWPNDRSSCWNLTVKESQSK